MHPFLRSLALILCILLLPSTRGEAGAVYRISSSKVEFHSKAPKELISATSVKLLGALDLQRRSFAFLIEMTSFQGFNNPLQREHFNENYMESTRFPIATFSGKIIEDVNLAKDGSYTIRAKGKLTIHGVSQERIIKCNIDCKAGVLTVDSRFMVPLADHNIKIPMVVAAKLATDILVNVHAVLQLKN